MWWREKKQPLSAVTSAEWQNPLQCKHEGDVVKRLPVSSSAPQPHNQQHPEWCLWLVSTSIHQSSRQFFTWQKHKSRPEISQDDLFQLLPHYDWQNQWISHDFRNKYLPFISFKSAPKLPQTSHSGFLHRPPATARLLCKPVGPDTPGWWSAVSQCQCWGCRWVSVALVFVFVSSTNGTHQYSGCEACQLDKSLWLTAQLSESVHKRRGEKNKTKGKLPSLLH